MKTITKIAIGFCLTTALSFGMQEWHGKLMDANCYNQNASAKTSGERIVVTCAPTSSTTTFAFKYGGKVRMLDAAGNDKAAAAVQQGLVKTGKDNDVDVAINGTRHGNTIKVESIRGHKSNTSVH